MTEITRNDVLDIMKTLEIEVDLDSIKPDIDLEMQGFDSLDVMTLFFKIEQKFSVKIGDNLSSENLLNTVDKIVEIVNKLLGV